jgi:hypothetical protein
VVVYSTPHAPTRRRCVCADPRDGSAGISIFSCHFGGGIDDGNWPGGIGGPANIRDSVGTTNLQVLAHGDTDGLSVTFNSYLAASAGGSEEIGTITGLTPGRITYATRGTPSVAVWSGSGNDYFDARRSAGSLDLSAGAGSNQVVTSSDLVGQVRSAARLDRPRRRGRPDDGLRRPRLVRRLEPGPELGLFVR